MLSSLFILYLPDFIERALLRNWLGFLACILNCGIWHKLKYKGGLKLALPLKQRSINIHITFLLLESQSNIFAIRYISLYYRSNGYDWSLGWWSNHPPLVQIFKVSWELGKQLVLSTAGCWERFLLAIIYQYFLFTNRLCV